jgi:2-polyprenyl-6-methoxyphenol hydroxylase-like FAD-dependent oxidoreductase
MNSLADIAEEKAARTFCGHFDVAIVGGGFGGTTAATLLARKGFRVALIDVHATYPKDFRSEKIAGDQIVLLRRNGLLETLVGRATPVGTILNTRKGRVVDMPQVEEYGLLYEDMIAALRGALPQSVTFMIGRVSELRPSKDIQHVALADGREISARLIILATGLGDVLRRKLGIERNIVRDAHSLAFGFNIEQGDDRAFEFSGMSAYGEDAVHRVDYLSVFPIGNVLRANLFAYRDIRDPWVQELKRNPREAIYSVLPGARRFLGDFNVSGKIDMRVNDLMQTEHYLQDGVVLIGDAFRTSCPAVGTGLSRLLTDVDLICNVYAPGWLSTPGMDRLKIADFYEDDVKIACDSRAAEMAEYRRASTTGRGVRWEAHRRQHYLRRQMRNWIRQLAPRKRAA